jgi:hypothetical protein
LKFEKWSVSIEKVKRKSMFMDWKGCGKVRFLPHDWMAKRKEKGNKGCNSNFRRSVKGRSNC